MYSILSQQHNAFVTAYLEGNEDKIL